MTVAASGTFSFLLSAVTSRSCKRIIHDRPRKARKTLRLFSRKHEHVPWSECLHFAQNKLLSAGSDRKNKMIDVMPMTMPRMVNNERERCMTTPSYAVFIRSLFVISFVTKRFHGASYAMPVVPGRCQRQTRSAMETIKSGHCAAYGE